MHERILGESVSCDKPNKLNTVITAMDTRRRLPWYGGHAQGPVSPVDQGNAVTKGQRSIATSFITARSH